MPTLTAPIQVETFFLIVYAEHPDDRDPVRRHSLSLEVGWAPSTSAADRRAGRIYPSTLNPGLPFSAHGADIELDRASGEVAVTGRGAALPAAVEEAVYWTYAPIAARTAEWARRRLAAIPGARYVAFHADTVRGTQSVSLGFLPEGEVTLDGATVRFHEYSHSRGNPLVEAGVAELAGLAREIAPRLPGEIAPR